MTQVERTPKTSAATPMRKASFFLCRVFAWLFYGVPIGILFLKNAFCIHQDISTLFPTWSIQDENKKIRHCPKGIDCKSKELKHFIDFQHPKALFDSLSDDHPAKPTIDRKGTRKDLV